MKSDEIYQEINLSFEFKENRMNAVLHTSFDFFNPYLTIIVPGIFGDRGDSRAMFTLIARRLSSKGFLILRLDFLGGGSNLGNYYENNFNLFIFQLDEITTQIKRNFGFIKKIVYVGFSEGFKFAYHVSLKRSDVIGLVSCNGLCVEEKNKENIKRPKLKKGICVYDSFLGTWINWEIVEKYKQYFVDKSKIKSGIELYAIYSSADEFSKCSKDFWEKNKWDISVIPEADHLYTKNEWIQEVCTLLTNWHINKFPLKRNDEKEFFLMIKGQKICMKIIENNNSSVYLLFLHGLFQNKSGPGFLYTQMANHYKSQYGICMFDFPGSGDSEGVSEEISYRIWENVLLEVANFLEKKKKVKIIAISSGISNYLVLKNKHRFFETIMLFPQTSRMWQKLSHEDKALSLIDTSDIYEKYNWAEQECCILGNIKNRSKGMLLSVSFLREMSEFQIKELLKEYSGYGFVNNISYCLNNNLYYMKDEQGLVMSAVSRDNLITNVFSIIRNIVKVNKNL